MKLEILHPQYQDTIVSTLLRTDTNPLYQFTPLPKDSSGLPEIDTLPKEKKKPASASPTKKKIKTFDASYLKVLNYKKELSKQNLISKSLPTVAETIVQQKEINTDSAILFVKYEGDTFQSLAIESNTLQSIVKESDTHQSMKNESDTLLSTIEVSPVSELAESRDTGANYRPWPSNDWMIGVLLVSLITLAWIRMSFRKLLIDNRKAVFSLRDSSRLFHDQNSLVQRVSFVLNMIFFVNLALFAYQVLSAYNGIPAGYGGIVSFFILLLVLILIYSSRVLVYRFLGYLFQFTDQSKEIIHNGYVINRITAFVLFPFIAAIPFVADNYAVWLIYIGIGLFGILYFLQLIRNMYLFLMNSPSLLYSFLYLCALEIVPVIVLIKFFNSFF
ncbi:MAG: DUF4271 domain-containing protein [Bacteroidales bacterium]|nr:DUF4271 domain-containing protein [Bacteroidales bacterium]MCF8455775.1 DUF4271 domain-containing protein [Bacteroidales bacterium]